MNIPIDVQSEMQSLQDEVNQDKIYLHNSGFHNYDMLRHLLEHYDHLTPEHSRKFAEFDLQYKSSDSLTGLPRVPYGWLQHGDSLSQETEEELVQLVMDLIEPRYEHVRQWLKWNEMLVHHVNQENPLLYNENEVSINDDWNMFSCLNYMNILTDDDVSIAAGIYPFFNYHTKKKYPGPVFEIQVPADRLPIGDSAYIERFSSYEQASTTLDSHFGITAPPVHQIAQAMKPFLLD